MIILRLYSLLALLLVLTISSCKNHNENEPELSAHIPLDEGKGTVITEIINGTTGSLVTMDPENSWISGPLNGALHFNGEDDHIIIPNNPAFDFGDGDFTISFMMRWPKGIKPYYEHLLTKGDYEAHVAGETGKRWEVTFIGDYGICFNIDDNVNRSSLLAPIDAFVTGEWVHVVMVRDTKNKQIRAYANGILQTSIKPNDPFYDGVDRVGNISNPQNLFIGDASRVDNPFKGEMDDIRIYKSALTPQQIINISEKAGITASPAATSTRTNPPGKPRIIVTSDGEIDDQCSMIRFMLYTNECDVEGIITSSSQYHWQGHRWAGDDWIDPDLEAYTKVYPNLVRHDSAYPSPEYLRSITLLGNVKAEGEMEEVTAGSEHIVKVLLDETDDRPIWLQAWGGTNTIARALKTIEEKHPEKMAEVADKCRLYLIWEQDSTYQSYIRPVWEKYGIPTIISDQFEAIAYRWKQAQPEELHKYFEGAWMKENILEGHGPLCSIYAAHKDGDPPMNGRVFYDGDFRSEGDSPAFLHTIITGLRNMESPGYGGWGGRFTKIRNNVWLDPVPVEGYTHPEGRWYGSNGWGRNSLRESSTATPEQRREYFKPMWRWTPVMQNDFAARADWCVNSYEDANHPPVVLLDHPLDRNTKLDRTVRLSAKGTHDPDGDKLTFSWWQYQEADSYGGSIELQDADQQDAFFEVPDDVKKGDTIHIICEVTDDGSPRLTRYRRVIIDVTE